MQELSRLQGGGVEAQKKEVQSYAGDPGGSALRMALGRTAHVRSAPLASLPPGVARANRSLIIKAQ